MFSLRSSLLWEDQRKARIEEFHALCYFWTPHHQFTLHKLLKACPQPRRPRQGIAHLSLMSNVWTKPHALKPKHTTLLHSKCLLHVGGLKLTTTTFPMHTSWRFERLCILRSYHGKTWTTLQRVVYIIQALVNFIKHHLSVSLNIADISLASKSTTRFQIVS